MGFKQKIIYQNLYGVQGRRGGRGAKWPGTRQYFGAQVLKY